MGSRPVVFISTQALVNEVCDEKRFQKSLSSVLRVRQAVLCFESHRVACTDVDCLSRLCVRASTMAYSPHTPMSPTGERLIVF